MPRNPPEITKLLGEADKIERRVRRSVIQAGARIARRLPLDEIERAIAAGDARQASALVNSIDFADAYEPTARILADAATRGGKLEESDIDRELS
jgi:hypothetical protein